MPLVKKQRGVKRVRVLAKRTQLFGCRSKANSYNTLYGKLKSNNSCLAKALSNQKQENQLLFSQNIELRAQLHALDTACNKRDMVISKVHKNAKEILNMLVNMTNSVTKTIMCCQEFVSLTDNNSRSSLGTPGRKDLTRRLSAKAPARGVVKPMVSGHTITKPTINLSRINMGRLGTITNLNNIEEVASPTELSPVVTDIRSSVTVSTNENRINYDDRRRRRLPERIPILLADDEEVRRLSRRNGRSSRRSRRSSSILSGSMTSRRSDNALLERTGSPRVTLNDVSKLLRNSQTFNVRQLSEDSHESSSNNNSTVDEPTQVQVTTEAIPKSESDDPNDQSLEANTSIEHLNRKPKKQTKRSTVTWEDPLEGPSWRYSNTSSTINESSINEKDVTLTGSSNADIMNNLNQRNDSPRNSNDSTNADESMEFTECITNICKPPTAVGPFSKIHNLPRMLPQSSNIEVRAAPQSTVVATSSEMNNLDFEEEPTYNFLGRFVTSRQDSTFDDENDDDYTLMYRPPQRQANIHYDVNDFKLPVLDGPILPPPTTDESEPEVTVKVQKITQNFPVPALSNDSVDRSMFEQTINVNLPNVPDVDDQTERISDIRKRSSISTVQKRKRILLSLNESPLSRTEKLKKKKKPVSYDKDPSAVKVVLQKLNESLVREKSPSPSPERISSRNTGRSSSKRNVSMSFKADASMDSENSSNASMTSESRSGRPRRQKAPVNLKEPKLNGYHRQFETGSLKTFQKNSKKRIKCLNGNFGVTLRTLMAKQEGRVCLND